MKFLNSVKKQWIITGTTLICGAVCGMHIAKLGPAMQAIIESFTMSLTEAGILASTFSLLTIFVGVFVGSILPGIGIKRLICLAMLLSSLGSVYGLISNDVLSLIFGRALEGIGLIIMMIAGPTAISLFTDEKSRAKHIGVWSAFMPLGTALSFIIAPTMMSMGGWRSLWLFSAIFSAMALMTAIVYIPNDSNPPALHLNRKLLEVTLKTKTLIWIGLVFAIHSLVFHIILQFMPIYGMNELGSSLTTISIILGVFCILNVFGNVISGYALHRGIRSYQLMSIHFIAIPILAILLFFPGVPDTIRFISLILGAFFTSLSPSAAFTLIAKLSTRTSEIPAFNGLMLQVQGAGILFGPALTGWLVETLNSWIAAGFVLIFASIVVLLVIDKKIKPVDLSS